MATITVSNQATLQSALASAKGGDIVVLQNGHYGNIRVTTDYASTVTIKAQNHQAATISNLDIWDASNLRFEGIKFNSGGNGGNGSGIVSIQSGSQNIAIVNSEVTGSVDGVYQGHYGIYVRNSNGVSLENNNVHDVQAGVVMFGSSNSSVRNNSIDYFSEDGMKLSGLNNVSIAGNKTLGHIYPTPGAHNDFIQFQGNSSNVKISENLFLPATTGWVQGIFFSDGTYQGIDIYNNIVYTGMARGVSVSDGSSGIKISNNTLLNTNGHHNNTKIFAPAGSVISDNITTSYVGGIYGSNVELQNANPSAAYYVNNYFKNGTASLGVKIQDLTPVAGSLAETKGAAALLKALLGGTAVNPAPAPAPSPAPAPASVDGSNGVAINAGGSAGLGFQADSAFSGGTTYGATAAIAGTDADAIYQTERWGNFSYAVAVKNGTYDVTLKFAELVWGSAGKRVFDVRAENQLVLDDYDIFSKAGGKNIARDETIRVQVGDGKLDLQFVGLVDNAKVGGIVVTPASSTAPSSGGSSGAGSVAINAGGKASGAFLADSFVFGGNTYGTTAAIAGTDADAIYQTERWGNFRYAVDVKNGTYDVTLKFAELVWGGAGQRVFDVKAENRIVLDDYDIFSKAGGKNIARDETFKVQVADGKLDLEFVSLVDNAKVGGIVITPSDGLL